MPLRPHRVDMKRHQLRGRRRRGGGWGGSLPRLRVQRVETISIAAGAEDSAGKEAGSTIGSGRGWGGAGSGGGGAVVRPLLAQEVALPPLEGLSTLPGPEAVLTRAAGGTGRARAKRGAEWPPLLA